MYSQRISIVFMKVGTYTLTPTVACKEYQTRKDIAKYYELIFHINGTYFTLLTYHRNYALL